MTIHLYPSRQPTICRAISAIAGLFQPKEQVMHPAKKEAVVLREPRPDLGPNQLRWLEERFQFYGIHRAQANAPAGIAVQSPGTPKSAWC